MEYWLEADYATDATLKVLGGTHGGNVGAHTYNEREANVSEVTDKEWDEFQAARAEHLKNSSAHQSYIREQLVAGQNFQP